MKNKYTFGYNLKRARARKGITQERLAELSGLHRTYISGLERGLRNPTLTTIITISAALEVKPMHLLKGINNDKQ